MLEGIPIMGVRVWQINVKFLSKKFCVSLELFSLPRFKARRKEHENGEDMKTECEDRKVEDKM